MFKSVGKGCRQTAAWFTDVTRDEVLKKRQEFWETRVQGDPNQWAALKAACEAPDSGDFHLETADAIVKASGLTMQQGYLLVCYDDLGFKYELPPFVVNEATDYGHEKLDMTPVAPGVALELVVRSAKRPDATVHINSNQTGSDLKSAYFSSSKTDPTPVRLFFNGREIKDNAYLTHLTSGVVVQAMG